jgi:hypothetical protein
MSLAILNDNINLGELNSLTLNSSVIRLSQINTATISGTFTVVDGIDVYMVNGTDDVTINLPSISSSVGRVLNFRLAVAVGVGKSVSTNLSVIPIAGTAGSTTLFVALTAVGTSAALINNGTNWITIRRQVPAA